LEAVEWWILRPDAAMAFRDREVSSALPRYIRAVKGEVPAQYVLASRLKASSGVSQGDAWSEHRALLGELRDLMKAVDSGSPLPEKPALSLLDIKVKLAKRLARSCALCERKCGVNRLSREIGVCGAGSTPRVASAFIHMGEEPPITPSGTVFFSGCNFRCVFCQNWDISQRPDSGREASVVDLAALFDALREGGARNVNLVGGEPTPNLPWILEAFTLMRQSAPIVWNSNMYMTENATELLLGVVDLWLPDFKYWDDSHALKYSGVPRYREVVTRNLKQAYEYWPEMVIRHLVMPEHVECCTIPILEWIAENTPGALVNVMGQYRPEYKAHKYPEIARRPTSDEIVRARRRAEELGLKWRSVS